MTIILNSSLISNKEKQIIAAILIVTLVSIALNSVVYDAYFTVGNPRFDDMPMSDFILKIFDNYDLQPMQLISGVLALTGYELFFQLTPLLTYTLLEICICNILYCFYPNGFQSHRCIDSLKVY